MVPVSRSRGSGVVLQMGASDPVIPNPVYNLRFELYGCVTSDDVALSGQCVCVCV